MYLGYNILKHFLIFIMTFSFLITIPTLIRSPATSQNSDLAAPGPQSLALAPNAGWLFRPSIHNITFGVYYFYGIFWIRFYQKFLVKCTGEFHLPRKRMKNEINASSSLNHEPAVNETKHA